jgi:phosphatidylglycerophosphate synthase
MAMALSTASAMPTRIASSPAHVRQHGSLLANSEKRVLIWLAQRLPGRVTADHLTGLGALAMVGAGLAFAGAASSRSWLWLVPAFLALNWFGDSLDGTLARVRGHERPRYGYYLDHVIDLANSTALFAGMAYSGLMQPLVAAGVLVGYILLCAEAFLATHALGVFRLSFSGFGPTELRIVLAIGAIAASVNPLVQPLGLGPVLLFDLGGVVAMIGMGGVFLISALRNGRTLSHAEPLPGSGR